MEAHRSTMESREPWPPIVDECFRFQGSRPIFYMYVCHGKWSRERHMEQGRAFRTLPLSEPPGHDIVCKSVYGRHLAEYLERPYTHLEGIDWDFQALIEPIFLINSPKKDNSCCTLSRYLINLLLS
ncbi:hypothetical protein FOVG_09521 [Fusarium oxysporum f. sp. pisi HDV247]|uniref:Uncharacterized protein n=1 Tax=Fusarium oxysporum f. sp. pisi HDV247 TaxID=1080344 RepID=W9P6U7_FUSOX|nr:hypothetical protein FOVG_09521 [Fusarium oxysporum f. sp. pisi HDV247]